MIGKIMKRKNDKGLTLVELIVAVAIFVIAGLAIGGFVSFCSNAFANSNENVKLQYDQQMVVNRVRDIVVETSNGISFDPATHTLRVFADNPDFDKTKANSDTNQKYLITQISWNGNKTNPDDTEYDVTKKSQFIMGDVTTEKSSMTDIATLAPTVNSVLSDTVNDFDVDLSKLEEGKVTLKFVFQVGDKEITVTPVVSLRNYLTEVTDATDIDDIYTPEITEFYSKVAKVEICRDGKVYAQAKTDTLAMAKGGTGANATSAFYTAIVTKKQNCKVDINEGVTWSIDNSNLLDGWDECISISGGKVTVKNKVDSTGAVIARPTDFIDGAYFVIVAASIEDPTKTARLRIKVATDGIYPVSITASQKETKDTVNGLLIVQMSHEITYTDKILDPTTNKYVNPLKDAGAFTKITYKVNKVEYYGSDENAALDAVPSGAGFTSTDSVDGKFIANKSMEQHKFYVTVAVTQRDKDGEIVSKDFVIDVPKGSVPGKQSVTVPTIMPPERALRGDILTLSPSWTAGVPTYKDGNTQKAYYYWYEFDIEPVGNNWGNDTRNNFSKLINFVTVKQYATAAPNNGDRLKSPLFRYQTERSVMIYCEPYLDWSKTFTYQVTLRVKLAKRNNSQNWNNRNTPVSDAKYYKVPTTENPTEKDFLTDSRSEAYAGTWLVTFDPVSLTLTPAYTTKKDGSKSYAVIYENGSQVSGVFNDSTKLKGYDTYYKVFVPEYKGLSVNIYNHARNEGSIQNTIGTKSSLEITYLQNRQTKYLNDPNTVKANKYYGGWYYTGIVSEMKKPDGTFINQLYYYLEMFPGTWYNSMTSVPTGCKWTCVMKDGYGNSVTAKFPMNNNADYMSYTYSKQ